MLSLMINDQLLFCSDRLSLSLSLSADLSQSKVGIMKTITPAEFTFLEEGFCARDIVDQNINELSMSVSNPSPNEVNPRCLSKCHVLPLPVLVTACPLDLIN